MPGCINAEEFSRSNSRGLAMGTDFSQRNAIVDSRGNVLAYAHTGGVISPSRSELREGDVIYRFGGRGTPISRIAAGAWWIERSQIDTLLAFANVHGLALPLALRILCLVPPEWSDLSTMVRARVRRPLLAWRGLGNSVLVRKTDGLGDVKLPSANEIAARRVYQLWIPGLDKYGSEGIAVEQSWSFSAAQSMAGWLYL